MKNFRLLLTTVAFALLIVACKEDPIAAPDKSEEYARDFIKTFGTIDPNHTWNMAGRVTINVSGLTPSSTVYVYDRMPGSENTHLAAMFSGVESSFTFDYPLDRNTAYIQIKDNNGNVIFSGSRAIKNGILNFSAYGPSKGRPADMPSNLFISSAIRLNQAFQPFTDNEYSRAFWENDIYTSGKIKNLYDVFDIRFFLKDDYTSSTDFDGTYNGIWADNSIPTPEFNNEDMGVGVSELQSIVGENGVFHEKTTNNECNLVKFWGELNPSVGVSYEVTKTGPVTLNFFYGSATFRNTFGYFFYREEWDKKTIMASPKYVIMYEASPWKNMQRYNPKTSTWEDFTNLGETGEGKPSQEDSDDKENQIDWYNAIKDSNGQIIGYRQNHSGMLTSYDVRHYNEEEPEIRYRGANFKLIYFPMTYVGTPYVNGADRCGFSVDYKNPTYDIPAGWKIGFFIISEGYPSLRYKQSSQEISVNKVRFSLPWMNHAMGQTFVTTNTDHSLCHTLAPSIPPCWFVSYKWGDEYIMGVEDGIADSSDHDMNDILFKITGATPYPNPEKVRDLGVNVQMQSWIVACEDLGNTNDYDFNDMVFAVSHVSSDKDNINDRLLVTPLAKGGTIPLKLCFNGTPIANGKFWHELFGKSATSVINAIGDGKNATYPPAIVIDNVPAGYALSSDMFNESYGGSLPMGGFTVEVYDNAGTVVSNHVTPPIKGTTSSRAPQMLLLPGTWSWPRENVRIQDAYPETTDPNGDIMGGFVSWCSNRNYLLWSVLNPQYDFLFNNNWKGESIPDDMK